MEKRRICDCGKRTSYGYNYKEPLYCKQHAKKDMVDVVNKRCEHKNCIKKPNFGFKGEKPKYCKDHKSDDMIDIVNKKCEHVNCIRRANFGIKGQKVQFCKDHKLENMVDLTHKKCENPGCIKQPVFGFKGKKIRFCVDHKLENMVDIKSKKCLYENCPKRPNFGFEGEKAKYCSDHKLNGMIDVKNKKCESQGCKKGANFGFEGQKIQYCADHKLEDMVNLNKQNGCKQIGCKKQSTFGYIDKMAEYCVDHKLDDMIDVKSKKCLYQGCIVRPTFGYKGQNAQYCVTHKQNGMIDLKTKHCKENNCGKVATFGLKGNTVEYCFDHKLENMIDLKHKKCEKCKIRASYGPLFGKKMHCHKHKNNNEYAKNNPKCEVKNCKNRPFYTNQNDNYPLRCEDDKTINDINIIEKYCKNCGLTQFIRENFDLCNDCYDFNVKKVHKIKETKVLQFLQAKDLNIISSDKIINFGCSKRRPDIIIDQGSFWILVEIDENQHQSYSCECEIGRMVQLFQDGGGIPFVFIRFNPDAYIDDKGNKCIRYAGREKKLYDTIKGLQNRETIDEPLSVIYLYYDEFDENIVRTSIDYEKNLILEQQEIKTEKKGYVTIDGKNYLVDDNGYIILTVI